MIDYECHKGGEEQKLGTGSSAKIVMRNKNLGLEEYRFLLKTMVHSGIGEETYIPRNIIEGREQDANLADAFAEMDGIIFDTLDKVFVKTGVSPSEIDIIITTISLFSPAPSLTARIINHYQMREDIKAFNLSGMGCSASVAAIDMVQHLFKSYKKAFAIVVSTESMGPDWYSGKEKSMMLSNILFRSGGCSMLLTNNRALKHRAILKLNCSVRTHLGSNDEAYRSCFQVEDKHGYRGFHLSRYLKKAAGEALTMNLRVLLPKALPLWEVLRRIIVSCYQNKVIKRPNSKAARHGINLKAGIDHFCIHPGGRAIIDKVGEGLGLIDYDVEPTRMALYRFGNTSAAGLWYVLGYMEAKKRLKKGDKILMISLGAGFECNNCVWEVMRDMGDANVWKDCIDHYPPNTLVNPFEQKFNWINDESVNFARLEDLLSAIRSSSI